MQENLQGEKSPQEIKEVAPPPELVQVKKSDLDALLAQLHVLRKRDADFMSMLEASTFLVTIIKNELFGGKMPNDKLSMADYMKIGTRAFTFSRKIEKEPGLMTKFGNSFTTVVEIGSHYMTPKQLSDVTGE